MEGFWVLFTVFWVIFIILQIILFFKVWIMTNHVKQMRNKYINTPSFGQPYTNTSSYKTGKDSNEIQNREIREGDKVVILKTQGTDVIREIKETENGLNYFSSSGRFYKREEIEEYNKYWSNYKK